MKRILFLVIVALFIVGCGGPDVGTEKPSANQKLVNFKCTMGDVQDYYFYEGDIKLESPASEGWIIDNVYYVKMDVNGKDYLITGMVGATEITTQDMIDMYQTSKVTPNFDCTLGGVTKAKVTLPNLEIISSEEMSNVMMAGMGGGFTQ